MGLVCDEWRRAIPPKELFRPWVKKAFDGVPSTATGKYTPAAAAIRAGLRSGKHLMLELNAPCPPMAKTDCYGNWLGWGECQSDGFRIERWTVEQWPSGGGEPCANEDGDARTTRC